DAFQHMYGYFAEYVIFDQIFNFDYGRHTSPQNPGPPRRPPAGSEPFAEEEAAVPTAPTMTRSPSFRLPSVISVYVPSVSPVETTRRCASLFVSSNHTAFSAAAPLRPAAAPALLGGTESDGG